ncbi:MAG: biotin synthase BioB [Gammaproteobacteria bacterium]|nr:biotin synthase BioB [Gammaproteobacteria bacterium]
MKNKENIRHDWRLNEVRELFDLPLNDLIFLAQTWHRRYFDVNRVQLSTLLNIKSGGCPEDCAYCPQSAHSDTGRAAEPLMRTSAVVEAAQQAQKNGATRFCMGAAWRQPKADDFAEVLEMAAAVKALGLETCATLGMLDLTQARQLKAAGLDYYNHNLDTSERFYSEIVTTRQYRDRLDTLQNLREAGVKVCCGGIIGMGESVEDRAAMLMTLANLPEHPESVPVNQLVKVKGAPLPEPEDLDPFDMVRCIAAARILMPASHVRLSAGRLGMSDELQALCFLAGANSIFYGEHLLTTDNSSPAHDRQLLNRLGMQAE